MKTSLLILATGLLLTAAPAAHAQVAPATRYVEDEGRPVYHNDGTALVQARIFNPMGSAATFAGPVRFGGVAAAPGYALASTRRLKPGSWSPAAVQARRGEGDGYRQDASRLLPAGEQVEDRAQEVGKLSPELVSTGPDGYKAVNYAQLTPMLLEAMKQQQAQIESLLKLAVVFGQRAAEAEAASISQVSRAEAATARLAQRLRTLEIATAHARRQAPCPAWPPGHPSSSFSLFPPPAVRWPASLFSTPGPLRRARGVLPPAASGPRWHRSLFARAHAGLVHSGWIRGGGLPEPAA